MSKYGRKILVLEQGDLLGGCCSSFERDGYTFDIGASIVEAIKNMGLVFRELGSSTDNELELLPCDPLYTCIFRDGSKTTHYHDIDRTAEEIGKLCPEDKYGFYRYVDKFQQFIDEGGEDFFTHPVNTFADMLDLIKKRPVIAKFLPFFLTSYQDIINHYFKDERVRASMSYQSFYAGHPPDLAPGIFAILPFFEHLGVYYPKGGMVKIPEALKRLGEQNGMEIRFNTPVERVLIDANKRVKGVRLENGEEIFSKMVISNVNAKVLYMDLIGQENLPASVVRGVNSFEYSLTAPMVYLGVDYDPPLDAHHSIIPIEQSKMNDAWWNKYRKDRIPDEQFGLVCCPTKTDPSLAPRGHHIINLILMGPYHLANTNWDDHKEEFIQQSIELLDQFAVPGLKDHVKVAEMSTPLDYERRLRLPNGAIYGIQQDLPAQAVFRPGNKSKCIEGLYLTGASTHPGGGVPTTITSGYVAAKLAVENS